MNTSFVRYAIVTSPIGDLLLTSNGDALTGLYMDLDNGGFRPKDDWQLDHGALKPAREQLAEYFASSREVFDLLMVLHGTEFQRRVWKALPSIPFGETISYAEVARRIGFPGSARAVGAAVGRNPISIVVPCHRVVGSNGSLTGYGGGLPRKRWLLEHEHSAHNGLKFGPPPEYESATNLPDLPRSRR
jgi:methylated-DNA-[protein]-cysteine S-methyltransferase